MRWAAGHECTGAEDGDSPLALSLLSSKDPTRIHHCGSRRSESGRLLCPKPGMRGALEEQDRVGPFGDACRPSTASRRRAQHWGEAGGGPGLGEDEVASLQVSSAADAKVLQEGHCSLRNGQVAAAFCVVLRRWQVLGLLWPEERGRGVVLLGNFQFGPAGNVVGWQRWMHLGSSFCFGIIWRNYFTAVIFAYFKTVHNCQYDL